MPRPATATDGARATAIAVAVAVVAGQSAWATPADDLGAAFVAYERGDLAVAHGRLRQIDPKRIVNRDYLDWLTGMVALRRGELTAAERAFEAVAKRSDSAFRRAAQWRLADVQWQRGQRSDAAASYERLITANDSDAIGDVGVARFRIAEARKDDGLLRAFAIAHPRHPLAALAATRLAERGAPPFTADERLARAKTLVAAHLWDDAISELSSIDRGGLPEATAYELDYWMGTTLFKMRRRYGEAGELLLRAYPHLGERSAEAAFHGARALSRDDRDDDAIVRYRRVVAEFPSSAFAAEAQFLTGWLEFNRGRYREAIAPLEQSLDRFPRSQWVDDALWFLGMSHYLLAEWVPARKRLQALAARGGALEGGKGDYWLARIDERLADRAAAEQRYLAVIGRYPFSWYALLARSRLAALGTTTTPFGNQPATRRGAALAEYVDPELARDPLIRSADELLAAKLATDAGELLARGERAFLRRHPRAAAFAMLLDRYRAAGNFNRTWMLAITHHNGALDGPPIDDARRWWEHAYPRAYRALVERHEKLGNNPADYLYSIMRKESGFNPHDLSYADAQGLLQMIPPTTQRVAKALAIPYDEGRLYEPEYNIQTASWYIGHLLAKFKGQIPIGAGSFNSGPRPVMKWLDRYGDRPIDELVELVPFTQTREYMKKVTENYARYRYLYSSEVYEQPLTVDKAYVRDQLTY